MQSSSVSAPLVASKLKSARVFESWLPTTTKSPPHAKLKLRGVMPPLGLKVGAASVPVAWSMAKTARLSWPLFATKRNLPDGCTLISEQWLAAFHTPFLMALLPCQSAGSVLIDCSRVSASLPASAPVTLLRLLPPSSLSSTSAMGPPPSPWISPRRVSGFNAASSTASILTLEFSSLTTYATRSVGWKTRCRGPTPRGSWHSPRRTSAPLASNHRILSSPRSATKRLLLLPVYGSVTAQCVCAQRCRYAQCSSRPGAHLSTYSPRACCSTCLAGPPAKCPVSGLMPTTARRASQ
mmetsp:Transcript_8827/g.27395  ORF Transcript_8827/g.27395 Transcript_8827/m.27395 type:complete len:295 (+) Transcript_8827:803-1687(+)